MSEMKLKPCPFCGKTSLLQARALREITQDYITVYVKCHECDIEKSATVPPGVTFEGLIDAKERVVEEWNRRAK